MTKATAVGVVGCGYWGPLLVRNFKGLPNCELKGLCDTNEDRLKHLRTLYPELEAVTDYSAFLNGANLDAVVIATPVKHHFPLAKACLMAGKHTFIEKPMASSSAECEELIDIAKRKGLVLMIDHTFLYSSPVRKIAEIIDAGDLGDIRYINSRRLNLGLFQKDINVAWDLAPHDISIFEYLLGSAPEWVSAIGASLLCEGNEDVGFVSLMYPNGIAAHMHLSWADPNKTREVVVVGSEKRILFNDLDPLERVRVFDKGVSRIASEPSTFGEFTFHQRDGDILSPMVDASEPLKNECEHFVECVRTGQRPLTDGHAGQRVVQVMEAIDESVRANGVPKRGPGAPAVPTREVADASAAVAVH